MSLTSDSAAHPQFTQTPENKGFRVGSCNRCSGVRSESDSESELARRANAVGVSSETLARFWAKVEFTTACWLWTASHRNGYGQFALPRIDGVQRNVFAHRLAYELSYGLIGRAAIKACHRCDTPLCVRPSHLFLGSQADNLHDARLKGRLDERLPRVKKLTYADRLAIFHGSREHGSGVALARQYGLTTSTVSHIRRGRFARQQLAQGALQPALAEPHQAERDGQIDLQAAQFRSRLIPSPEIGIAS